MVPPGGDLQGPGVVIAVIRRWAVVVAVQVVDAANAKLEAPVMLLLPMCLFTLVQCPRPLATTLLSTLRRSRCSPRAMPCLAGARVLAADQRPLPLAPCSPVRDGLATLGLRATAKHGIRGQPASRSAMSGSSTGAPVFADRIALASTTP